MSKQIQAGPASLEVGISAGGVVLKASIGAALGGGEAQGVVKASASMELDLSLQQAVDLGLALVAAKLPSLAPEIAVVQAAIDAEIAKLSV